MTELEAGDMVTILVGKHAGKTGTVKYPFCDYGDHMLSIDLLDGTNIDISDDEESVEYLGEDKYEYSVQFHWLHNADAVWTEVSPYDWMDKEDAENWWLVQEDARERAEREGGSVKAVGRIVKRRKAGRTEVV